MTTGTRPPPYPSTPPCRYGAQQDQRWRHGMRVKDARQARLLVPPANAPGLCLLFRVPTLLTQLAYGSGTRQGGGPRPTHRPLPVATASPRLVPGPIQIVAWGRWVPYRWGPNPSRSWPGAVGHRIVGCRTHPGRGPGPLGDRSDREGHGLGVGALCLSFASTYLQRRHRWQ
jgi:hypothetical protein